LVSIPADTDRFAATLSQLDIGFNLLTTVPPAVGLLTKLTVLDLQGNQITSLPEELALLGQLRDLILSYNRFTTVPSALKELPALETLLLNDNQLTALDMAVLSSLPVLSCLEVSNNSIGQVPPELGLLPLKTLKLEGKLPVWTNSSVHSLALSLCSTGNTFRMPRPAVLAQGTPAILEYLKSRVAA
jgi:Leucine-rich repeat (LRR) protein